MKYKWNVVLRYAANDSFLYKTWTFFHPFCYQIYINAAIKSDAKVKEDMINLMAVLYTFRWAGCLQDLVFSI